MKRQIPQNQTSNVRISILIIRHLKSQLNRSLILLKIKINLVDIEFPGHEFHLIQYWGNFITSIFCSTLVFLLMLILIVVEDYTVSFSMTPGFMSPRLDDYTWYTFSKCFFSSSPVIDENFSISQDLQTASLFQILA